MPPRYARGRSPPTSPRAEAVGDAKLQKELLKSLFCSSVPSGFRPCGLFGYVLTQLKRLTTTYLKPKTARERQQTRYALIKNQKIKKIKREKNGRKIKKIANYNNINIYN
ncbi:MAG TPA: hypothetical protein PK548_01830 [Bacteroidales bacterium]|nr:hypothetical protein [Bacteroidales bacterium]HQA86628.1 hypothetical protein [Bacteroidales bacterium]